MNTFINTDIIVSTKFVFFITYRNSLTVMFLPLIVFVDSSNSTSNRLKLNSRIIGSLVTGVSSSFKVDVIVQLVHLEVRFSVFYLVCEKNAAE